MSSSAGGGSPRKDLKWFTPVLDAAPGTIRKTVLSEMLSVLRNRSGYVGTGGATDPKNCYEFKEQGQARLQDEHPRIAVPKSLSDEMEAKGIEFPKKIQVSHLAMLAKKQDKPAVNPPAKPINLGHSATVPSWVCSHLCHNKKCCRDIHLVWEPDWYNHLRDQCAPEICWHTPRCIKAHKVHADYDWRSDATYTAALAAHSAAEAAKIADKDASPK